jgi:hypothetical protein
MTAAKHGASSASERLTRRPDHSQVGSFEGHLPEVTRGENEMKTICIDLYGYDELAPEAQAHAYDDWRKSDDFSFSVEDYQRDAQDDFEIITSVISDSSPSSARDCEPSKVTEARAICGNCWVDVWHTWAGYDMELAMKDSDFICEIRLALRAYDAMRDLEDAIETDSADYSESVYGLEAMICDLRDCFMNDLRRARDRVMDSVCDDLDDPEYFAELARADEYQFTEDGERWDR